MQGIVKTRIFSFALGLILVPIIATAVILFAKGYRPNLKNGDLRPTGILVAQSDPDGAQVYLDGILKSATNSNLTLSPAQYTIEIKKSGFTTWKKLLTVDAGIVTRATAKLFPSVPSLKAVGSTGALHPLLSPGGTKISFVRQEANQYKLYILDLNESPLGLLNRDAQLVYTSSNFNLLTSQLVWSPDSRQILAVASSSALLVDLSSATAQDVSTQIPIIVNSWTQTVSDQTAQKGLTLSPRLQDIFATSAAQLVWSPKENKVLYVATSSATIPNNLIQQLPGSSTQPQDRLLKPRNIYVYDLEEDRNFLVGNLPAPTPTPKPTKKSPVLSTVDSLAAKIGYFKPGGLSWFPTSNHLFKVENGRVIITEYDNQNPTIVYEGPMFENFAAPYPSGNQLLILTNLNPTSSTLPNLYAVTLK